MQQFCQESIVKYFLYVIHRMETVKRFHFIVHN